MKSFTSTPYLILYYILFSENLANLQPCHAISSEKQRAALVLSGAVCHMADGIFSKLSDSSLILENKTGYCDISVVSNSIKRHVFRANEPRFDFDVFLFSWNVDLAQDLTALYEPNRSLFMQFPRQIFVNLSLHYDIPPNELSRHYAIQQSLKMCQAAEELNGKTYSIIVLMRLDVLLFKDVILDNYNPNEIYNNCGASGNADFHFIMNSSNARQFSKLYDYLSHPMLQPLTKRTHLGLHRKFASIFMNNLTLTPDDLCPPQDLEVYRKVDALRLKAFQYTPTTNDLGRATDVRTM